MLRFIFPMGETSVSSCSHLKIVSIREFLEENGYQHHFDDAGVMSYSIKDMNFYLKLQAYIYQTLTKKL